MASQQPTRPFFRLPSLARPAPPPANGPPPPPAAAPEPPAPMQRPPLVRPTFRPITMPQPQPQPQLEPPAPAPAPTATLPPPVSAPSQPPAPPPPPPPQQNITTSPPSPPPPADTRAATPASPPKTTTPYRTSSVPSSPQKPIVPSTLPSIHGTTTTADRVAPTSPPPPPPPQRPSEPSARTIMPTEFRTPPPQPSKTNYGPPPSPLILPPPQAVPDSRIPPEAEQKTILVQKTFADTRKLQQENHHRAKKVVNLSDSEEGTPHPGMRVITIAGENKGAFMELVRPRQRTTGSPHYLYNKGNSSSGEERGADAKRSGLTAPSPPRSIRAFTNSNVQGVNNSIVYNSSCNHHDPGVHLSISRKLAGGPPPPPGQHQRPNEGSAGDNSSGGN